MRYWLSFDLGFRGNYDALYEWLDNMEARECGDGIATFNTEKTREEITKELSKLKLGDKARIYIISQKHGGKFILGRRKQPPWTGYGALVLQTEEER